jgi:hypothetical protein
LVVGGEMPSNKFKPLCTLYPKELAPKENLKLFNFAN